MWAEKKSPVWNVSLDYLKIALIIFNTIYYKVKYTAYYLPFFLKWHI